MIYGKTCDACLYFRPGNLRCWNNGHWYSQDADECEEFKLGVLGKIAVSLEECAEYLKELVDAKSSEDSD